MDLAPATKRLSDDSGSFTAGIIFTDVPRSSVTPSTANNHSCIKSLKIPAVLIKNVETGIGTPSLEDSVVRTDQLLPESGVEMSSQVQDVGDSAEVVTGSSQLKTAMKSVMEDFSQLLNLTDVATAVPLGGVMNSTQLRDVSQTRISEAGQNISALHNVTTAGHVSTPYKHSFGLHSSLNLSVEYSAQPQDVIQGRIFEAGQNTSVLLDLTTTARRDRPTGRIFASYKHRLSQSTPVSSTMPKDIFQIHSFEAAQKTSALPDVTAARRNSDQFISTSSYKRGFGLQSSSSASSSLQKCSTVAAEIETEISSRVQSSSTRLLSRAFQETTSQSTVASGVRHLDDHTITLYHSGECCSLEVWILTIINRLINNYLRQGGYVFARLCLFVCLSVCQQDNLKSSRRIFLKF